MANVFCPDSSRRKVWRWSHDVLLLGRSHPGAEYSIHCYKSMVFEVCGFHRKVNMPVEAVADSGNAQSHQDSERENDRLFNPIHDDQMLLSSLWIISGKFCDWSFTSMSKSGSETRSSWIQESSPTRLAHGSVEDSGSGHGQISYSLGAPAQNDCFDGLKHNQQIKAER